MTSLSCHPFESYCLLWKFFLQFFLSAKLPLSIGSLHRLFLLPGPLLPLLSFCSCLSFRCQFTSHLFCKVFTDHAIHNSFHLKTHLWFYFFFITFKQFLVIYCLFTHDFFLSWTVISMKELIHYFVLLCIPKP